MMGYKYRCEGCGRGTNNVDGECDWCREREREFVVEGDDDVSAMERRYEREIDRG